MQNYSPVNERPIYKFGSYSNKTPNICYKYLSSNEA